MVIWFLEPLLVQPDWFLLNLKDQNSKEKLKKLARRNISRKIVNFKHKNEDVSLHRNIPSELLKHFVFDCSDWVRCWRASRVIDTRFMKKNLRNKITLELKILHSFRRRKKKILRSWLWRAHKTNAKGKWKVVLMSHGNDLGFSGLKGRVERKR